MTRRPLLAALMLAAAGGAAPAAAADAETLATGTAPGTGVARTCLADMQAFEDKLARTGFGVLPPAGFAGAGEPGDPYVWGLEGTPRQKMRALREAAYVYAWEGDEAACGRLLASMQRVFTEHQALYGSEADDPMLRTAWRQAHLAAARPVAGMDHLMRADVLIGAQVRNLADTRLGEIDDVVFSPDGADIVYVLAARGGFLGIGRKLVALRWSDLRATGDHRIYVLDASEAAVDAAPTVDRAGFEATADAAWRRALTRYWDDALAADGG